MYSRRGGDVMAMFYSHAVHAVSLIWRTRIVVSPRYPEALAKKTWEVVNVWRGAMLALLGYMTLTRMVIGFAISQAQQHCEGVFQDGVSTLIAVHIALNQQVIGFGLLF